MDAGHGQEPFKWREPMQTLKRCPKCHARLIVTPAEERCPYCTYSKHTALPMRERPASGIDMSLRNQIDEAIGEATDEYGRPPEKFVDFEVPRENNFERYSFVLFFIALLIVLRIAYVGHRRSLLPHAAPEYVWYAILLPSLLYLLTNHTTFLLLKPVTMLVGLSVGILAVSVLPDPSLIPDLWKSSRGPWLAYMLLGYQAITGFWMASLAWRDWRVLRGR
jgi:hypothetical protein